MFMKINGLARRLNRKAGQDLRAGQQGLPGVTVPVVLSGGRC
jgi:hypothetical protein